MYCPTEDWTCPYYQKNGVCKLGWKAVHECDDAYAAMGDDDDEEDTASGMFVEPFAVYDPYDW